MSSLAQVETPQRYSFKVMSELLVQAKALDIDLEELIGFLAAQVQAMLNSPPNYSKFGQKARAWVMRGFYPGTGLFFKLTIGASINGENSQYCVKASGLRVNMPRFKGGNVEAFVLLDSAKVQEDIVNRMENAFFNADHELQSLLETKIKLPRCMSPKGCKIFSIDKETK